MYYASQYYFLINLGSTCSLSPPALAIRSTPFEPEKSPADSGVNSGPPSPSNNSSSSGTTGVNPKSMTSEELGYEKVKPTLASPGKHFATSTVHKLAERLGIGSLGNGLIKPTEDSRTVICNPAMRMNDNSSDSKLKKKSKKKKKNHVEKTEKKYTSQGEDDEENNNVNGDSGDKKKKSKKKKKAKKEKKKAKEKERESAKEPIDLGSCSRKESVNSSNKKSNTSKASETSTKINKAKLKGPKQEKQKATTQTRMTRIKKVLKQSSQDGLKKLKIGKKVKNLKRRKAIEAEERRRQEEAERKKKKRRSMLDELRNSDGYVAEKRFKKTEDLFADPSKLGREERALQVNVACRVAGHTERIHTTFKIL